MSQDKEEPGLNHLHVRIQNNNNDIIVFSKFFLLKFLFNVSANIFFFCLFCRICIFSHSSDCISSNSASINGTHLRLWHLICIANAMMLPDVRLLGCCWRIYSWREIEKRCRSSASRVYSSRENRMRVGNESGSSLGG